jgi:hypothetical protein
MSSIGALGHIESDTSGIYFARLETEHGVRTQKVEVAR